MCGFLVDTGSGLPWQVVGRAAARLSHRGPDHRAARRIGKGWFVFHRLSVMDPTTSGHQPFTSEAGVTLVCNGEIYNEPELRARVGGDYAFTSRSDCEVLLPLFEKFGIEGLVTRLDAEFALVLHDGRSGAYFAARDPLGIRPLFYGKSKRGDWVFASEAKALGSLCEQVRVFPPGHYFDGERGRFVCFHDLAHVAVERRPSSEEIDEEIRRRLTHAVSKRLRADAPLGFLLSGGLDSSLVCAIAARLLPTPPVTFAVGIEEDPIDLAFARDVAEFLGTDHHEVRFTREQVFRYLSEIIYHLETWDITTIRAAVGMYLVCRYIRQNTDIKVVLTGEVSDELFGYKYTDFAPSPEAFQAEAAKRIREIHMYDVLRADRCISAHALEARVPFGDLDFAEYVMSLAPILKMNSTGMGKNLLRRAFAQGNYLPEHILYREKAAFSDAVGHSMVDALKRFAEREYDEFDLARARQRYPHCPPFTKEALLYRELFDAHFPNGHQLIVDYWMPNRAWSNCNVADPSARALPNYGQSGARRARVESCLAC